MTTKSFSEERLKSWSDIHNLPRTGWIYRGQRMASWPLQTSLERCFARHRIPLTRALEVESDLLREFRRAYHNYSQHIPSPSDKIEWLSLMQHHGAPTRLLDFTYSIYVASYFAIETTDEDAAIWAIDGQWAMEESARLLKTAGRKDQYIQQLQDRFVEGSEHITQDLFFESPIVPLACPLNPFHLNERLRIQKGVFLISGSVQIPFVDNLMALPNHSSPDRVLKIIIPQSCVDDALVNLFQMNISRATLFPGLDGYAQSLGVFHPSFRKNEMLWYLNKNK
jgi:hypothetical protein